jgi:hypothetical protein
MVVGWAPWWTGQTERTTFLTVGVALKRQIQNLRRTRDLLLPRLLSGQIDVEALPELELTAS